MSAVVDASTVLNWLLAEELSEHADALFTDSIRQREPLLAPPLLPAEVINAVFQRIRRRTITIAEAHAALGAFYRLPLDVQSPPDLYDRAFSFALTHNLTKTYDAVYVVLAQITGSDFWTADERLINSLGSAAPWVRWLGDYPLPIA